MQTHTHIQTHIPRESTSEHEVSLSCRRSHKCLKATQHNQQELLIQHNMMFSSSNNNNNTPLKMSMEDLLMEGLKPSYADLESEIARLKEVIYRKDQEIIEYKSAVDKYQAILTFSSGGPSPTSAGLVLSSPLSPRTLSIKKRTRTRLFGISAEPSNLSSSSVSEPTRHGDHIEPVVQTYPKDDQTRILLENAIQSNDFMKHLDG